MNSNSDSQSSLRRRVSVAERVDKICDEFEARLRSGGNVTIESTVGQGAFATVYRAYDPQLDRDIALKIPQQAVTGEPTEVARVLREARAAAQLLHPNIPIATSDRRGIAQPSDRARRHNESSVS